MANIDMNGNSEEYLRGLDTVRVSREILLEEIRKNRLKHAQQFDEALTGWKVEVINKLERDLTAQRKEYRRVMRDQKKKIIEIQARIKRTRNDDFRTDVNAFGIVKPTHHIDDYEGAIKKLEMSLDRELELPSADFDRYVMDNWQWKNNFTSQWQTGLITLNNPVSMNTVTANYCNSSAFITGSAYTNLLTSGSAYVY